ncbi:MAG: hypothetical protein R3D00_21515 [Bacteroidia bacterium]
MKINFFFLPLFFYAGSLLSQVPDNDACENARRMAVGEEIFQLDNQWATVSPEDVPEGEPVTCIKSFENDLWFTFTTESPYRHYQVLISPLICNTPAGIQALLIRSDDCESGNYRYVDCGNPYAEQAISLFLDDSIPGNRYLIYVDGYDGTQCTFNLSLSGTDNNPRTIEDYRRTDLDYGTAPPLFEPSDAGVNFINNEAEITWGAGSEEDVQLFLVEKIIPSASHTVGKVIGSVEPATTVGSNQYSTYRFVHREAFEEGKTYCYRIVKVDSRGTKSYSDQFCNKMAVVEGFYASPVFPSKEKGIYIITLRNERKQELIFTVLSESGEILKQMSQKRAAGNDGEIEIDMNDFSSGNYFLRIEGKNGFYLRRFQVE